MDIKPKLIKKPKIKRNIKVFSLQFLVVWMMFLLGLNLFVFTNKKGGDYIQKKKEISRLKEDIVLYQQKKANIQKHIQYLNSDEGIEKLARDKIGLVKPGELAFIVVTPKKENTPKETCNIENEQKIKAKSANERTWFKNIINFFQKKISN